MKPYRPAAVPARRGSLLVPLVAAITILSLSGIVLSQTFSGQRMQSVLAVESSRAFWTAEAGAWHAAMVGASLDSAVEFDSGSYLTESASGPSGEPQSIGQLGTATRRVSLPGPLYQQGGTGGGEVASSPLNESTSSASATRTSRSTFSVLLDSVRSYPAVLSSVTFTTSDAGQSVESVQFDGNQIWATDGTTPPGTAELDFGNAPLADRIVEPGTADAMVFELRPRPRRSDTYTLLLRFTDDSTSQLQFSISW